MIHVMVHFENAAGWIGGCLDSLIRQTERNWTVWAFDNHSTDGSAEIAKACLGRDPFGRGWYLRPAIKLGAVGCFDQIIRHGEHVRDEDLLMILKRGALIGHDQCMENVATLYHEDHDVAFASDDGGNFRMCRAGIWKGLRSDRLIDSRSGKCVTMERVWEMMGAK